MSDESRIGDLEERVKALEEKMQILVGWIESTGGIVDKHTDRIQALEIKHEALEGRTLGWQEGFGGEVRRQLKRIDERITNLEVQGE